MSAGMSPRAAGRSHDRGLGMGAETPAAAAAGRKSLAPPDCMPAFIEIRRFVRLSYRRANILLMRPALKPGLLTVWRNRDTVQFGIDPRRAVALTGMRGTGDLLRLLDGSRDRRQVLAAAGDLGMDAAAADRVLA